MSVKQILRVSFIGFALYYASCVALHAQTLVFPPTQQVPAGEEKEFESYTYLWIESQTSFEKRKRVVTLYPMSIWQVTCIGADCPPPEPELIPEEYFTTVSFSHQHKRWLGIYAESAHGNYWGESMIGPAFAPTDSLQIVVAGGVEHYEPRKVRGRFGAYYEHEGTGSFLYADLGVGKSGNWYSLDAVRMFGEYVGLGAALQMPGGGAGPKIEFRAGNNLGLWVAPVYEWKEKTFRVLLGGRIMFEK